MAETQGTMVDVGLERMRYEHVRGVASQGPVRGNPHPCVASHALGMAMTFRTSGCLSLRWHREAVS